MQGGLTSAADRSGQYLGCRRVRPHSHTAAGKPIGSLVPLPPLSTAAVPGGLSSCCGASQPGTSHQAAARPHLPFGWISGAGPGAVCSCPHGVCPPLPPPPPAPHAPLTPTRAGTQSQRGEREGGGCAPHSPRQLPPMPPPQHCTQGCALAAPLTPQESGSGGGGGLSRGCCQSGRGRGGGGQGPAVVCP